MRIDRINIENFKSIKKITLSDIKNFNILIGRNNSGKSNIFDALLFLKDGAIRGDIRELYESRNGFENISFGRNPNQQIKIEIFAVLNKEEREKTIKKLFESNTFITGKQAFRTNFLKTLTYKIQLGKDEWTEELLTDDIYDKQLLLVKRSGDFNKHETQYLGSRYLSLLADHGKNISDQIKYENDSGGFTRIVLGHVGSQEVKEIAELFRKLFLEQLRWMNPYRGGSIVRGITGNDQVDPEGKNLADVMHTLLTRDKPEYSEILSEIVEMVPDVEKVLTPPSETQINLEIREKGFSSDILFPWENLSSGLKNLLDLLCLVTTSPRDSILLIEEPEIHLHPGNQRKFFNYLKEKSIDRQIWLTTHSPVFAGQASLEEITLITKDDEGTKINTIDEENVQEVLNELEIKASDFFESDFLVLVEDDTDGKILQIFYDTLVHANQIQKKKICFLGCGGWGNIEYYANARILKTRKIPVNVHAIFDGDVSENQSEKVDKVKRDLDLDENSVIILKQNSIENYLLVPRAINEAFPELELSEPEIGQFIQERKERKNKKRVLKVLFKEKKLKYHEYDGKKIAKAMKIEEIDPEIKNLFLEKIN